MATTAEQVASIVRNNNILTPANQLVIDEIFRYYRISSCQLTSAFREKGEAEEKTLMMASILEDKKLH